MISSLTRFCIHFTHPLNYILTFFPERFKNEIVRSGNCCILLLINEKKTLSNTIVIIVWDIHAEKFHVSYGTHSEITTIRDKGIVGKKSA